MGIIKFIRKYWTQTFLFLGTIGMSTFGSANDIVQQKWAWFRTAPGYMFSAAAIITVVGTVATVRQSNKEENLETKLKEQQRYIEDLEKNNELRIGEFIAVHLFVERLFHELDFSYTERITIYRFDGQGFVPLHRYSLNENFCLQGRRRYPSDQGCISKAWTLGDCYVSNLPDPEKT